MEDYKVPYGGQYLISHLIAYGLAVALDAWGSDCVVYHDRESATIDPVVATSCDEADVAEAVRASARAVKRAVEHDIDPEAQGNARRATIWARATAAQQIKDPKKREAAMARLVQRREELLAELERERNVLAIELMGALGAPATWRPARGSIAEGAQPSTKGERSMPRTRRKPRESIAEGATALDGALGNNTSDLVRGALRRARAAAEESDDPLGAPASRDEMDRTGWAPPDTRIALTHQWLAVLGMTMLPVAHRLTAASATPACWRRKGNGSGIALPVLPGGARPARLKAVLRLEDLSILGEGKGEIKGAWSVRDVAGSVEAAVGMTGGDALGRRAWRAAINLRGLGVESVVSFARHFDSSSRGRSKAFYFEPAELIPLGQVRRQR